LFFIENPATGIVTAASGSPYLGQIATRVIIPNALDTASFFSNSRRAHVARDAIASCQIIIPNFYITPSGEQSPGAASTVTASIEYPVGTRTQVKFSGVASRSIPNGSFVVSDAVTVAIPKNSLFFVWIHTANAAGRISSSYSDAPGAFMTEAYEWAATDPGDKTMSGTITSSDPANGQQWGCCGIIAQTVLGSVYIVGDSRSFGVFDDTNANGDLGEISRAIGPTMGYMNISTPGLQLSTWLSSNTNQLALSQYCSAVVMQQGLNDLSLGAVTAATLAARRQTALALFPGKKVFETTLPPETNSTDGWATLANQNLTTPTAYAASNTQRIAFNTLVRAGSAGMAGYFEIADQIESSRNSGLWNCPVAGGGTATAVYTVDGIHELAVANNKIASSGVINPAVFSR
jgi:hypothetical protein